MEIVNVIQLDFSISTIVDYINYIFCHIFCQIVSYAFGFNLTVIFTKYQQRQVRFYKPGQKPVFLSLGGGGTSRLVESDSIKARTTYDNETWRIEKYFV